jgi:DNA-binding response OmpR family regulator
VEAASNYLPDVEPSSFVLIAMAEGLRRRAVANMLSKAGYEVLVLGTGSELLHHLYNSLGSGKTPDLVLCDAELEGIDGAQICKISRAQNSLLPFIVIARPGFAGAFDSLELGEDACVVTSDVDLEDLKFWVETLAGDP